MGKPFMFHKRVAVPTLDDPFLTPEGHRVVRGSVVFNPADPEQGSPDSMSLLTEESGGIDRQAVIAQITTPNVLNGFVPGYSALGFAEKKTPGQVLHVFFLIGEKPAQPFWQFGVGHRAPPARRDCAALSPPTTDTNGSPEPAPAPGSPT